MGLLKRKPVLKCEYCRDSDRRHMEEKGVRVRILPSWPYMSVNAGDGVVLFDIKYCPKCGRKL